MNCIEARRMVTPYVNKELSDKDMEQFLKHIEHCRDCRDELDIYFTMYKAIDLLDSGSHQEFDFRKMLENDIRASHRSVIARRITRLVRCIILLIAEVILLFCVYTGYEMRKGELERSSFQRMIERLQEFAFSEEDHPAGHEHQAINEDPSYHRDWTDKSDIIPMEELLDRKSGMETEIEEEETVSWQEKKK